MLQLRDWGLERESGAHTAWIMMLVAVEGVLDFVDEAGHVLLFFGVEKVKI